MMKMQRSLLRVTFLLSSLCHLDLAFPSINNGNQASKLASLPNNICPKLICDPSNMTVTFLKKDLSKLKVDLNNIHLIDPTCKGFEDSENTMSIQSPTRVTVCGTNVNVNDTHAVYKNRIYLKPDPSLIIYREEYVVDISCIYPLDMDISLGTVLNPIMSTIYITVEGIGQFEVKMALYKDPAYTIPRQQGDTLSTKDFLYVGVNITKGDTSRFHLVMKDCFSTPTQNFNEILKYYIIQNSCKNKNDQTIHVAANGIASYGQFSVQAFKFIGGYDQIFLHCQVHLCDHTSGSCIPICNGRNLRNLADGSSKAQAEYLTLGAMTVKDTEKLCPDLQCGTSYINVTLQKNDLISANVDISKLHINKLNCHDFYDDGDTVTIGWPLGVGNCGTTLTTNTSHAIYQNSIYLAPNSSQIIYRQEYYINVSCVYPLDMNISLHKVLNPMISTITILLEGIGSFEVVMAAFKDQAFQQPYQIDEISLSTQQRLFIGVFISKGDTAEFHLVMQQCYATPTNNPQDAITYGIIVNSCPNKEDGTVEVYANGISSQGQFSIQMFKFINYDKVFLHCKVHLCRKSTNICIPVCPKAKLRSAEPQGSDLSFGPIYRADLTPDLTTDLTTIATTTPDNTDDLTTDLTPIATTTPENTDDLTTDLTPIATTTPGNTDDLTTDLTPDLTTIATTTPENTDDPTPDLTTDLTPDLTTIATTTPENTDAPTTSTSTTATTTLKNTDASTTIHPTTMTTNAGTVKRTCLDLLMLIAVVYITIMSYVLGS